MNRSLALVVLFLALTASLGCPRSGDAPEGTGQPAGRNTPSDSLIGRADAARIQGSATAPVWVVEVSDFQCPFCKTWHDSVYRALRREFVVPGTVRFAYINYPLPTHANALP